MNDKSLPLPLPLIRLGVRGTFHRVDREPVEAEIVHVWSDTCVNLLTDAGFAPTSVYVFRLYEQPDAPKPAGYYFVPYPEAVQIQAAGGGKVIKAGEKPTIDQELTAMGKTAPRVTPADLEAAIASEHYFSAAEGVIGSRGRAVSAADLPDALSLLTFCVLLLHNGFTVTGESACASPENYDAEIGKRVARAAAVQKMWPLLGFQLKEQLYQRTQPASYPDPAGSQA